MARATSVRGRVNGATQAYLGNTRSRAIGQRGNRLASRRQNYYRVRVSLGLSGG